MTDKLKEIAGEQKPVHHMLSSELALVFAKEILAWKDARIPEPNLQNKVYHLAQEGWISLDYRILQSVMQAVREWLSAKDPDQIEQNFEDIFNFSFGGYFAGAQDEAEICHHLMVACVEARRREE